MLHAPDDAPEHPQVAAQHRGLVHQPEHVRLAHRRLQDGQEARAVDRVAPERAVHLVAHVVQRAQRARRQALQALGGLVQQEGLEDRVRLAQVQVVAGDLEQAAAVQEAFVDRLHRQVFRPVDAFLEVEQQHLVELRHRLGRPVVALHQHLGRAHRRVAVVAERLGHGRLQVEHQAVLAAAGDQVQARADQLERALLALQLLHLEWRQQPVRGHLAPGLAQARGARDPGQHLQVAQAARALLAVGLQRVGRVLVLDLALAHLERLRAQERARVHRLGVDTPEHVEHAARTGEQAALEQRRLHGDVGARLEQALVDRAHRRADLQADVPARRDEGLDRAAQRAVMSFLFVRQQHQHVDVRVREQLAAAEAADGQQRGRGGHAGVRPQVDQGLVDVPGQRSQQAGGGRRGGTRFAEMRQQRGLAGTKALAQLGDGGAALGRRRDRAVGPDQVIGQGRMFGRRHAVDVSAVPLRPR